MVLCQAVGIANFVLVIVIICIIVFFVTRKGKKDNPNNPKISNISSRTKNNSKAIAFLLSALVVIVIVFVGSSKSCTETSESPIQETALKSSENEISNDTVEKYVAKVDSARIKELLPYFTAKKDEFSPDDLIWYYPKSAPKYRSRNAIYLYFCTVNGKPRPVRFVVQYYNNDWLFFDELRFSIDGNAYVYEPINKDTDCGHGGMIWEWFDDKLTERECPLIFALCNAENAKMKFIGKKYSDIKHISKQQILDVKRVIELHQAMGGDYIPK